MGDLWMLLFLPVSLVAFHGVKGCLECDPRFIDDIMTLLRHLVPAQVPGRAHLLARQHKEIIHLSSKVSHKDKTLRLMAVANAIKLRTWMKDEFYRLGNETWKGVFIIQGKLVKVRQNLEIKVKDTLRNFSEVACSEDCIVTEGPVLDCWSCFRMTTRCFRGDYCKGDVGCGMACEENPKKAENREISLYLILMAEAVILASAVLLFHICVLHRRKMKVIRSTLKTYLEKKLEELVGVIDKDEERNDLETWKSSSRSQTGDTSSVESEMQTGT